MQIGHRRASPRRHRHGRSIATGAHTALHPHTVSRALRSRSRVFRRATGSAGAGTDRQRILLQFRQRPLRTLLRHRFRENRDAVPERSLRPLRGMRRPTFSAARAQNPAARQIDSRRARVDRDRSDCVFRADRRTRKAVATRSKFWRRWGSVICGSVSH